MTLRFGQKFVSAPAFLFVMSFLVMLMPGGSRVSRATQEAPVQGDVTCDSSVNAVDSLQILRDVAGLGTTAGCLADAGDVNCDAAVNSVDALRILRYVAGLSVIAPGGCAAIGEPLETGPDSYELIEAALDAGHIDAETALKYKVFATFGDPRLPAEYQGDDSEAWDDPMAVVQAASTFDTLSAETQALLAPFLLSPEVPGSWQQLRAAGPGAAPAQAITYSGVTTSPNVIIWYRDDRPQDEALAQSLANEVDARIWPQLTGLMGQPKPDTGRADNYDDRIDVWLSGDATRAHANATPPWCNETSGYIVLGAAYSDRYVLTHELMHVIDYHFALSTCWYDEYRWIHEATSQWSIDFVYPDAQKEWGRPANPVVLKCFLDHPNLSLERRNDCHEYSAYLLLFYLHRNHNQQLIRDIWDAFKGEDSLGGVNAALAAIGGLKEVWPKFVLQNYNRPPETWYKTFDNIPVGALLEAKEDVSLGGGHMKEYGLRGDVDHLGALYHEYTFTDPAINQVTFRHSLAGQATAFVRALIKYQGDAQWKDEDWTGDPEKKFCYDDPGQKKFEKLIVIISNSEYQNRSHVLTSSPQPELKVNDECAHGWQGTATSTWWWNSIGTGIATATFEGSWEAVDDRGPLETIECEQSDNPCLPFYPTGNISWSWNADIPPPCEDCPPCHESVTGQLAASPLPWPFNENQIFVLQPDGQGQYRYWGNGYFEIPGREPDPTHCENTISGGISPNDFFELDEYASSENPTGSDGGTCYYQDWMISSDATTIKGSCYAWNYSYHYLLYEWEFHRVGAP